MGSVEVTVSDMHLRGRQPPQRKSGLHGYIRRLLHGWVVQL